jgi:hypothetical protein
LAWLESVAFPTRQRQVLAHTSNNQTFVELGTQTRMELRDLIPPWLWIIRPLSRASLFSISPMRIESISWLNPESPRSSSLGPCQLYLHSNNPFGKWMERRRAFEVFSRWFQDAMYRRRLSNTSIQRARRVLRRNFQWSQRPIRIVVVPARRRNPCFWRL